MPDPIQLIIERDARSGAWNMAADEFLVDSTADSGRATVRIYEWDTATISLGYFQDADEFRNTGRFEDLPAVRRLSGGGAILHDRELTYSVAAPRSQVKPGELTELYAEIHTAIISLLAAVGVDCEMRGSDVADSNEQFLCFVRGDRHDIVCRGHKIVGSAQRRRRGAVLQHGSLILSASPHAPEIPGVCDLIPGLEIPRTFATTLGEAIARILGDSFRMADWSDAETDSIRAFQDRYLTLAK